MGYWHSNDQGHSFTGELTWGDAPADVMDEAILEIIQVFEHDVGRKPTKTELIAGMKFSLRGLDTLAL